MMSDDMFKSFKFNAPSTDFLNDVYKAQLMAMNRAQPVFKAIDDMNALSLSYSHLFKAPALRFTAPPVNLGIDLDKLNEAIKRINEPLLQSMETVSSITSKQFNSALFSKEIFNDVYNLSGISPEIIEHTVTILRFNAEISIDSMHTSMKSEEISSTINDKERNKVIEEIQKTSAPLYENEVFKYLIGPLSLKPIGNELNNLWLSLNPIEDVLNNLSFNDLFISNQLAFALVCIYIYVCAFIKPYS